MRRVGSGATEDRGVRNASGWSGDKQVQRGEENFVRVNDEDQLRSPSY